MVRVRFLQKLEALIDVREIGDGILMFHFQQGKMLPFLAGRISNT
jgi:hypothetical protein